MPEPLKNIYTVEFVTRLAENINRLNMPFNKDAFINHIFDQHWSKLELKQRMNQITVNLHRHLNCDYLTALPVLQDCCKEFGGFESMLFPHYVELYGQHEYEASMQALEIMTQFSSSEFAIRPFIVKHPKQTMSQMLKWSKHKNFHVRRLASEGCRPRLPWAMALPKFKHDPELILPILNNLKNDESEYVRRSVANNLNDISKDHPDMVLSIAKSWQNQTIETDWIIKHACRSLLKQGNTDALALFGLTPPDHIELCDFCCDDKVKPGSRVHFSALLKSTQALGLCRIEYRLYFQKANGTVSPKVFKISESMIPVHHKEISRAHSFKPITTRTYYKGLHQLEIIVNGVAMDKKDFYII